MANPTLEKINYQIGRLCRLSTRKAKLMAISNRRKQQLRHLGERVYIFKALQQDDDIWEKDEISQLLLTIADLDQEQEMLIDEINEIKAENPPTDLDSEAPAEATVPAAEPAEKPAETKPETAAKIQPEVKKELPETKPEAAKTKPAKAKKASPKAKTAAPRKKAAAGSSKPKSPKKDKAKA